MTNLKLDQDIKVLTFFQYIKDDWYGTRYRVVLIKDDHTGFENKKESKLYSSMFASYIKYKHKWDATLKQLEFNKLGSFITYEYNSFGPSYYCTNIYVTISEIENWYNQYLNSREYKELQEAKERRSFYKNINKVRTLKTA